MGFVKILVVTPHYYPEGFSITAMCEEWVKEGNDVFVVTNKPNYGFGRILPEYRHVNDETINGVRIHRCNCFARKNSRISIIKNYLSFYWTAKRYLSHLKEEFDVVYSFSLSPIISVSGANVYAKKHHVRHILHCLDLWPESVLSTGAMRKGSLGYRILYHWSKRIYGKADEILVSSPSFKAYFQEVLKLPGDNISFVPQPPYLVEQNGDNFEYPRKNAFLYAGNIGRLQLVEQLCEAFYSLPDEAEATLYIIGMGARQKQVERLVKEKHLENRVVFFGPKPRKETARYYANADAIVVSLADKGFVGKTIPNKLSSSLYYGKPFFAVIQGDGRAILEKTGGAVLSNGEDPASIRKALLQFLKLNEEEKTKMGEANKKCFDKAFSFSSCMQQINEHLKK